MNIFSKHKKRGLLVAFEGLSSSGKTGCLDRLAHKLRVHGTNVTIAKWNSVDLIRRSVDFLHKLKLLTPRGYSIFQWKSFLISYYTTICPQLNKGDIVLADRYIYTAYTRDKMNGIKNGFTRALYKFAQKPDFIFFFKTPPDVCYERTRQEGKKIFHLCKRITDSPSIGNKDLHYLRELYETYEFTFKNRNLLDNVKVIEINGNDDDLNIILKSISAYSVEMARTERVALD